MRILPITAAALALSAAAGASAQDWRSNNWRANGWQTIAFKTVNGRDTDRINLPGVTRQRMVRVCALNAPLHLRDLDIHFANGGHQDAATRAVLGAGTCTRAIDLKGNRRDIAQIQLKYEPIARSRRVPVVRVQVR